MAQLLAYLFTITLSHLAMLLRWLGITQPQQTWSPDIEANSALIECTSVDQAAYHPLPSSVPSNFSIRDGSNEDSPTSGTSRLTFIMHGTPLVNSIIS